MFFVNSLQIGTGNIFPETGNLQAPAGKGPAETVTGLSCSWDGHIINSVRRARFSIHLPVFAWHVASPSIRSQGRAVARTSAFRSSAWVAPDRHDADHAGQYHLRPDLPEELLRRISSRRDWRIEPTRSRPGRDFRRLGRRGPGSDRPRRHKTVLPQTRPDPCFIESRGARVGDRAVSEEIRSVQLLHLPATQRLMACSPRAQGAAAAAAGPGGWPADFSGACRVRPCEVPSGCFDGTCWG